MADPGSDSRTSRRSARTVAGATMLEVEFDRDLSWSELDRLRADARQAMSSPTGGALPLFDADISAAHLSLRTIPIPTDAIRLDALFAAFAAWGSPFGSPISAYLVARIAEVLAAMRRAERSPPIVDRAGVLINGDGSIQVLAFGVPALDAYLRPEGAPDVQRPATFDVRDDVRALGTLYCELLSGQAQGVRPLPDPRPSLIEVLKSALAADPALRFPSLELFSDSVARESAALGSEDPRAMLAKLIEQWVDAEVPRGDVALSARYLETLARGDVIGAPILADATIPKSEEAPAAAAEPEPASEDAWSAVLGEKIEKEPAILISPPVVATAMPQLLDIEKMTGGRSSRTRLSGPIPMPLPEREKKSSRALAAKIAAGALSVILVGGVWVAVHLQSQMIEREVNTDPQINEPRVEDPPPPIPTPPIPATPDPNEPPKEGTATKSLLTVMSRPLGATVELDGGYVGKTPLVLKHTFTKADYLMTVSLDRYKTWSRQVYVDNATGSINVMAVLESAE